jgi:hypothetical protein
MASATNFLHESTRRSESSEHVRRHSDVGTTLYWHDCGPYSAAHGYWATTMSSPSSAPNSDVSFRITSPSPVEEERRSRLATKSVTGFHSLFTSIRSKSNNPPSRREMRQPPHSTSSTDISSLDARYCPRSYLETPQQSSHRKVQTTPDLSALVPDYLDDPPPYSSPVREHREAIDWKTHFDRTPILTRTVSPHSSPAIQDVMSPQTSVGGAWDRVARRLIR